jgi:hypothetical protein
MRSAFSLFPRHPNWAAAWQDWPACGLWNHQAWIHGGAHVWSTVVHKR